MIVNIYTIYQVYPKPLKPTYMYNSYIDSTCQVDALRTPPPSVSAAVNSAMDAAIHTHLPTHAPAPANNGLPWRPRGLLVSLGFWVRV